MFSKDQFSEPVAKNPRSQNNRVTSDLSSLAISVSLHSHRPLSIISSYLHPQQPAGSHSGPNPGQLVAFLPTCCPTLIPPFQNFSSPLLLLSSPPLHPPPSPLPVNSATSFCHRVKCSIVSAVPVSTFTTLISKLLK